jgi:hypothetical protein
MSQGQTVDHVQSHSTERRVPPDRRLGNTVCCLVADVDQSAADTRGDDEPHMSASMPQAVGRQLVEHCEQSLPGRTSDAGPVRESSRPRRAARTAGS